MQPNRNIVIEPLEKIISIISYYTMGIVGLVWVIIGYFLNKRVKFFLMYNITQSVLISIFLAFLNILFQVILQIIIAIPFLSSIGINISLFMQKKINIIGLSFNIIEIIIFLLLIYISIGVIQGRIYNVPVLTKIVKRIMQSYR